MSNRRDDCSLFPRPSLPPSQDTLKKPLIDPVFEKAFLIEDVTDSIKVEHHKYWAPPFVSKRDMCVRLNKARLDDGTVVLTGKSVAHKECPEDVRHIHTG